MGGDGDESLSGDAEGGDVRRKRAYDAYTAGGNAYSGSSGDTSSGNIINEADDEATVTNTGPGTSEFSILCCHCCNSTCFPDIGDTAGDSTTGDAEGGQGDGKGPGGNAYSGFAGPSRGGNVLNEGGSIGNTGGTSKLDYAQYGYLTDQHHQTRAATELIPRAVQHLEGMHDCKCTQSCVSASNNPVWDRSCNPTSVLYILYPMHSTSDHCVNFDESFMQTLRD